MVVSVIGSRTFKDFDRLKMILDALKPTKIISGGALGADSLGEKYADDNGIEKSIHLPDWAKYNKSAGFIRNQLIIDEGEVIVACWDLKSNGTADSINKAKLQGKDIYIIYF